jgi:hypothetical protein
LWIGRRVKVVSHAGFFQPFIFFPMTTRLFSLTPLALACVVSSVNGQTLAFPGAEGFGRFATGARGGEVYHVTHLNDSGPGSFRDALSQPHRTVVFDVGGVIRISSRISVSPNVTIAGQSAPGDGIVVYGNAVSFTDANQSITRHIRFRMGVNGEHGKDAAGLASGHDMIFDHVSVSWGRDENFSMNGPVTNITIQNCIIGQGLEPHSCGGLIQSSGGISILRTLYIDNHTRNPKVKGVNQFVNNVVYNWGGGGCYILGDSAGESTANVTGNYFICGPVRGSPAFTRGNTNFHIYAVDNFEDSNCNGRLDGAAIPQPAYGTVAWRLKPFDFPPVVSATPQEAFRAVANQAGSYLRRDAVDRRFIAELLSVGTRGEMITNENTSPINGVGEVRGGVAPLDTDRDGMSDEWELANGLNSKNAADRNELAAGGYTRLEQYLNWLGELHVTMARNQTIELDLESFSVVPDEKHFRIVSSSNCSAELLSNHHSVRLTPTRNFSGLASIQFARDGELPRTVGVCVKAPEVVPLVQAHLNR